MAFLLSALLQSLGSFSEPQNEKVADKFKARSWPPLDMAHVIPIIGIVSPHNPVVSFSTTAPVSPCRGSCVSIRLVLRPGQLHASPLLLVPERGSSISRRAQRSPPARELLQNIAEKLSPI